MTAASDFGIAPTTHRRLLDLLSQTAGVQAVWIYGSRARGTQRNASDIDLAVDASGWEWRERSEFLYALENLGLMYRVDVVFLQDALDARFLEMFERDRQLFWQPRQVAVSLPRALGFDDLKEFQAKSLLKLDAYLTELRSARTDSDQALAAMAATSQPWTSPWLSSSIENMS
jgi:type III restriction enzyme